MENKLKNKILTLSELVKKRHILKQEGKKVVQSHGVFDLVHPGIIKHLNQARSQGEVLIVTVIKDKDVRRGPGRPIFPESFRAESVASLGQVDFVCIVDDETPFECLQVIKPDIFAKGQAYKERDRQIHQEIFTEEKEFSLGKEKLYETDGFHFSSTGFLNQFLNIYPDDTKAFLKEFAQQYPFGVITEKLNELSALKVLVIGDGIIDEYHYCEPMGKAAKSNLVVNKYFAHEVFAGGTFAVANHVAGICGNIHLVSLLGSADSREDFIRDSLKPNVTSRFFYREDGPTIVKKRYIHQYLNQKLFEVNFINDTFVDDGLESQIIDYLKSIIKSYDLVLLSDFGHGFISEKIYSVIEREAKILAVNTQTNAANAGYNLITKYHNPNFVCLDEPEIRLAAQSKYGNIDEIALKVREKINADFLIVTLGKRGSIGVDRAGNVNRTPIFSNKVVDTIGAGDAFFAYSAPCFARGMGLDLVSFVGNAVGALAVQIVGNKRPVEKHELLELIHFLNK